MKKYILSIVLLISSCASAFLNESRAVAAETANQETQSEKQSHIRLWRGFKQDELSESNFKSHVSSRLIPATVTVGAGKGLSSYLPVFLLDENKPAFLPDEVAVIQYESESAYKALAQTPEFMTYGKLHYEAGAFVKKNSQGFTSGSLVSKAVSIDTIVDFSQVEPFVFHIGNVSGQWQNDKVYFRYFQFNDDSNKSACAQTILSVAKSRIQSQSIKGMIYLYDSHYVLVYERVGSDLTHRSASEGDYSNKCFSLKTVELVNSSKFLDSDSGVNMKVSE